MATALSQKALGAFYTADSVASFLVRWAIRKATDRVLDPSCGCGAFIGAALTRLSNLGCTKPEVWGVDHDEEAVRTSKQFFPKAKILKQNFFAIESSHFAPFEAVVGNPPFIRYQTFSGEARVQALKQMERAGVRLPRLASSWAPFLIHAVRLLRPGGRLAMVVPAELGHAQYARHVLRFLADQFATVRIYMFRRKLFPELSEDTFLLLADGRGSTCRWFSVSAFDSIGQATLEPPTEYPVDIDSLAAGRIRLFHYLLPPRARALYERLIHEDGVVRLGDVADVGIGYVTGFNDYFHLTAVEAFHWRIQSRYLRPCVTSLSNHQGLIFRRADWDAARRMGDKVFLFSVPPARENSFAKAIKQYLRRGEELGVPARYKCRVRDPWYSVPHVREGDALLAYMSGNLPRLVLNPTKLVAPNTLHLLRFMQADSKRRLVVGWHSSLTRLSCEMEGHALGGGMLKIEPTEAERLAIPLPRPADAHRLMVQIDAELRCSGPEKANDTADNTVLRRKLGLTASECAVLRDSAEFLERWRMHR